MPCKPPQQLVSHLLHDILDAGSLQHTPAASETKLWPRGHMVAVDLAPESILQGCQDFMRCVKYEETPGEVNKVLGIPRYYHYYVT